MRIILVFTIGAAIGLAVARRSAAWLPHAFSPRERRRNGVTARRNLQFNTRASQATIDAFSAIAEQLNCPVAEVLQALQRELDLQLKGA
jgi:hypothetical protein